MDVAVGDKVIRCSGHRIGCICNCTNVQTVERLTPAGFVANGKNYDSNGRSRDGMKRYVRKVIPGEVEAIEEARKKSVADEKDRLAKRAAIEAEPGWQAANWIVNACSCSSSDEFFVTYGAERCIEVQRILRGL